MSDASVFHGVRELVHDVGAGLRAHVPWRAAALWGLALGLLFPVRGVIDLVRPDAGHGLIYHWLLSGPGGMVFCFAAGWRAAWRRRDFGHGGLVALTAILIAFVVAIIGNVSAVLVLSRWRSIDLATHLRAAIEVPLPVMFLVGGSVGAAGAALGAAMATRFGGARVR
jgi:hypothetical protein